jgi:outer membrane protein
MAFQVGADYMLTDNVMINAQVRYIDIDTRATVENDAVAPGTRARVNLDVDPFIYMVGLGYKF